MKSLLVATAIIGMFCASCNNNSTSKETSEKNSEAGADSAAASTTTATSTMADAATIMQMPQVPVLCYHHIRDKKEEYSVSPQNFESQMKILHDSGYNTVLPEQLYDYLAYGKSLPAKPVMLSFDDTDLEQFTLGYTEMKKYNFKGVFFIMTIAIGKQRYMTRDMIKQLADEGNAVECHTWDHHMVTKYQTSDWDKQITEANATIESITGKKVTYFAYPFGLWKDSSIAPLKARDIRMAFQLSAKRDSVDPLYTVRRMIVPSGWSSPGMLKAMKSTFAK